MTILIETFRNLRDLVPPVTWTNSPVALYHLYKLRLPVACRLGIFQETYPHQRSSYPQSQSGTGVAPLVGAKGEDMSEEVFLVFIGFVHRSLANPARYRLD